MNTHTLDVTTPQTFDNVQESVDRTVDNATARSSTAQKISFLLVWAAVAVPLVWGVLKAWEEVQLMF
jgi:hypothetical protein